MRKSIGLLAVIVLLAASAVRAEMLSPSVIETLIKTAIGKTSADMVAGREVLQATSNGVTASRVGSLALAHEGFIIAGAGKAADASVVVKAIPRATQVYGWSRVPHYVSEGELEIGVFRVLKGKAEDVIKRLIKDESEAEVLHPDNEMYEGEIEGSLYTPTSKDDVSKMAVAARELMARFNRDSSNVIEAMAQVVKTGDGQYGVIRSIRINAQAIDAAQAQELIDAAKGLL